jgi:uncharacterized membrane protein (UPF0127 family)
MKLDLRLFLLLLASLLAVSGCQKNSVDSVPPQTASQQAAQPKLPVVKLTLGSFELDSEIASSERQMAMGMMFRKEMAENEGMLFVFPFPHKASFYMRNTYLPLSCAYIDADGVILEIHDMKPLEEKPITAATDQIQYVLETTQGWFDRHQITIGTTVQAEGASLRQKFQTK